MNRASNTLSNDKLKALTMNAKNFVAILVCSVVSACAMQPPAPTADVARVAQIAPGKSQSDVEKIMQRPGRLITYALKPDETTQIWRYEDHLKSMCLFVTYNRDAKVIDVATFEREREERGRLGTMISGSC
jgi:hypothetical protein